MKYFFSEIDEITLTFSDIQTNSDGMKFIKIYFEHPNANGFDFLESTLPTLNVKNSFGFNQDEQTRLLNYAKANAFLIWDIAREGGEKTVRRRHENLARRRAALGTQQQSNSAKRFEPNHAVARDE